MPLSYGTAPAVLEKRTDRPRQLLWSGVLQSARGPVQCLVVDISERGARLSVGAAELPLGQAVTLMVAGMGLFRGSIISAESGTVGVRFSADRSASAA
ncbi:MAG: PilZ domain-containing protein [Stellaceae bacterium]